MARTAFLVLGMHRSGTSALTRMLEVLGAALPLDALPPQADNSDGFGESRGLVDAGKALLRACGSNWFDPRPLALDRLGEAGIAEHRARIRDAIAIAWGDAPLLAIKDPRHCRFVPLVVEALRELDVAPRVVLVQRPPAAVACSLAQRNGFGAPFAALLWLRHVAAAERDTRMLPRAIVRYDGLIEDWRAVLGRIAALAGLADWRPGPAEVAAAGALLDQSLRHHHVEVLPPSVRLPLKGFVERVWKGLSALAEADDHAGRLELTRAYTKLERRTGLDGDVMLAALRPVPSTPYFAATALPERRIRVHAITPHGANGPQSSAYIRLLSPLSDEVVRGSVEITLGPPQPALPACDICIVQRAAFTDMAEADALRATLASRGTPLVVDLDDDFLGMGDDHPDVAHYRPRIEALAHILAGASEVWFSMPVLAARYAALSARSAVIPNTIDPRLWRDWRRPPPIPFGAARVRMLYMGTKTHAADWAMIRPALERLWRARPGAFDVTLIGVTPAIEEAPWLHRLEPPARSVPYPSFVAWLRAQGPFDLGLAPLVDTAFNRAKSDIKLLEYAALGLLPVASDIAAYRTDAAAGAILVDDWNTALAAVLDSREDARARAAQAYAHVWARRTTGWTATLMLDRLAALVAR